MKNKKILKHGYAPSEGFSIPPELMENLQATPEEINKILYEIVEEVAEKLTNEMFKDIDKIIE